MKKKQIPVSFVSLGCFKNVVDTEVLGGMLEKHGMKVVSSYEPFDWLIINTCGFIRESKEESIDEILAALEKKEHGEIHKVAVFGCLTQRYYDDLKKTFKMADIIWGVNDLDELARRIAADSGDVREYPDSNLFLYNDKHRRIWTTTPNSTFLKISEGCNMTCSFCAIPQIRGPYRSRDISSILKEIERYQKTGIQEINLISQNSSYFGKDRQKSSQLPQLLKEVSTLGIPWIRVLYLMPEEVDNRIIEAFSHSSIVPYFDLPFQHVNPRILKKMNRSGDAAAKMSLLEKIRKRFERAVIRTSFIVGFPGESDLEFEELRQFARESRIERIGVFGYSPEEQTGAFDLPEKLPEEEVENRKNLLLDISDANIQQYNRSLLGKSLEFLPLGTWDSGQTVGRIVSQSPETDGLTLLKRNYEGENRIMNIKINKFDHETVMGVEI